MTLLPLDIPPGILKVDSLNAGKGRYTDADKIRFVKGRPEKWQGWTKFIDETLTGKARGAASWTNQYGNSNIAFGTNLKLFVITGGDKLTDITPTRTTGTLAEDPFETTEDSAEVTVNHSAHGLVVGDYVTFEGAEAVGGITIDGEYVVTSRTDANSYTITHSSAATSSVNGGGGASVTYEYNITIGHEGTIVGLGWGAGPWGEGTWSTPRTEGISLELRHWSLQEYGNDLLASPSGGGLYLWQEASDTRAEVVSNAPTSIRSMFVTGERFIFALGTTTPMTVQWPDRDDITDWTAGTSDTANTRTLQSGSKLMAGTSLADAINLVWSDTSVYVFQYTGSEFIYDDRLAGTNCGLIGPLAFAEVSGMAFWMSSSDFHLYNGSVSPIPNSSDVKEFVFADMDPARVTKTWCVYDQINNQVRWGYCSVGSDEPDKYVDVSLEDWSWTTGTLDRTTGTNFKAGIDALVMVDHDGNVWEHNVGNDDDDSAMESFITYGLYALSRGEDNVDVMGIVPDCQRQSGSLSFEVYTRERPNSTDNFDEETAVLEEGEEIADIRVSGRHFGMTVRSNEIGGDFRLGIPSLEIQNSGKRR